MSYNSEHKLPSFVARSLLVVYRSSGVDSFPRSLRLNARASIRCHIHTHAPLKTFENGLSASRRPCRIERKAPTTVDCTHVSKPRQPRLVQCTATRTRQTHPLSLQRRRLAGVRDIAPRDVYTVVRAMKPKAYWNNLRPPLLSVCLLGSETGRDGKRGDSFCVSISALLLQSLFKV